MDIIFITELRVDTVIGINEWERRIRQTVSIDLQMATDIRQAADSDAIDDTLNYKSIAKKVLAFVEQSQYQLIETLTERIADLIIKEFETPWVQVSLSKPGAVRSAKNVGVIIERGKRPQNG